MGGGDSCEQKGQGLTDDVDSSSADVERFFSCGSETLHPPNQETPFEVKETSRDGGNAASDAHLNVKSHAQAAARDCTCCFGRTRQHRLSLNEDVGSVT